MGRPIAVQQRNLVRLPRKQYDISHWRTCFFRFSAGPVAGCRANGNGLLLCRLCCIGSRRTRLSGQCDRPDQHGHLPKSQHPPSQASRTVDAGSNAGRSGGAVGPRSNSTRPARPSGIWPDGSGTAAQTGGHACRGCAEADRSNSGPVATRFDACDPPLVGPIDPRTELRVYRATESPSQSGIDHGRVSQGPPASALCLRAGQPAEGQRPFARRRHHRSRHGQSRSADAEGDRRQALRSGARSAHASLFVLARHSGPAPRPGQLLCPPLRREARSRRRRSSRRSAPRKASPTWRRRSPRLAT